MAINSLKVYGVFREVNHSCIRGSGEIKEILEWLGEGEIRAMEKVKWIVKLEGSLE